MTDFNILLRKAVSIGLVGALAFSMTGCFNFSKNNENGGNGGGSNETVVIDASSPWYNVAKYDIDATTMGFTDDVENLFPEIIGHDDDSIVVRAQGIKKGYDYNDASANYYDYMVDKLCIVSIADGSIKNTIDLMAYNNETSGVNSASLVDGKVDLQVYISTADGMDGDIYNVIIDPTTGEEISRDKVATDDFSNSPERTFELTGYTVNTYYIYDDNGNTSYKIGIIPEGGEEQLYDVELTGIESLYDISGVIETGEGQALAIGSGADDTPFFFTFDLKTGAMAVQSADDYSWLDTSAVSTTIRDAEGATYGVIKNGICKFDFAAKTMDTVFDYGWSNVNVNNIASMSLVNFSENQIVYAGTLSSDSQFSAESSPIEILVLTKADTNPNAGKTTVDLYCYQNIVPNVLAEAVCAFNESSADYHIVYNNNYNMEDYYDQDASNNADSDDDFSKMITQAQASISDKLAVDMMNGEGPDILFNASSLVQLNSSDYLMDMSSYASQLPADQYFTNVLNAAKTGDALYQVPIGFSLSGVITNKENVADGAVGFTFDDYASFVDSVCNGTDPITSGQAVYFTRCFSAMADKFLVDGQANFSNADFNALAEYVKNNVPENSVSWGADDDGTYTQPSASAVDLNSLGYYLSGYATGNDLLGLPSSDARGPYINTYAVAVSAQCSDADACWSFIQTLLGEEAQTNIAMSGICNPVNTTAFDSSSASILAYYQNQSSSEYPMVGDGESSNIEYTQDMVDDYKALLMNANKCYSDDAAIDLILMEEMPAYFTGQKTLDEVVEIMQDRVQTVLNERG